MHKMHLAAGATLLAVMSLTGCQPPPNDYEVCNSYGLSPGSDGGFAQCMGERQQRRMQAAQFLLGRQPQPYYQQPYTVPYRTPVTTNCTRMGGGMVSCSSF